MSHGNHHYFVTKLPDVSLLIKYIADDSIFQEKLGRYRVWNGNLPSEFTNLFSDGTACLFTGLPLYRYVHKSQGNWDNYEMHLAPIVADSENVNNKAGNNGNNKVGNNDNNEAGNENPAGPLDNNLDELYGVYN